MDALGEVGERTSVDTVHVNGVKHIFMICRNVETEPQRGSDVPVVAKHECWNIHHLVC